MFKNSRTKREAAEFFATLERAVKGNDSGEISPNALPKVQGVDARTGTTKHDAASNENVEANVPVSTVP